MEPCRGQGVDQAVGADVVRPVDADGERAPCPALATSSGRSRRAATVSTAPVSAGTTDASAIASRSASATPSSREQPVEQELELVGRRPGVGRRAAGRDERAGPEEADRDVRVADVEGEQHGAR